MNDEVEVQTILSKREEVTVHGLVNEATVNAKIDTGADRTTIDETVACAVGAGPLVEVRRFRGSSGGTARRLLVELSVTVCGTRHEVNASVADRSNLETDVRIGCDVLGSYLVNV